MEIVEGILKANSIGLDGQLTQETKKEVELSNTQYGKFGFRQNSLVSDDAPQEMTVDGVYQELISLRNQNRVLGDRIKHLEVQNFHMTA